MNCYKIDIRKSPYFSLFFKRKDIPEYIPPQDVYSCVNLISELSFRERVGIEEIDSDFFRMSYVDLQSYINGEIRLFKLVLNDSQIDSISTEFLQIARIRVRNDLREIFGKLNFEVFQNTLKSSNCYRSSELMKQSVWNKLQTTYCNMLFVCNNYVASLLKSQFEKYVVDEIFINRIIDAFIESIYYEGIFASDNQKRYDLWWNCTLRSIRKPLGSMTSRRRLALYEKQIVLLNKYETGRCGVNFIQTPQLRFFLEVNIESVRLMLEDSGRPKYNYVAHIEDLRKLHHYLYNKGFTDTKFAAFVKCWEKGVGRINWLHHRTSLVQFHEILLMYTNLLDLVDFENFIIDNYLISGSIDFDIESIVKKKKSLVCGERGFKKFKGLISVIDLFLDDYKRPTANFRGE